ncbi:MAG TPA: hypothetical protein PLP19_11505 [bacterium]|nr:hypothetical protein [bacterium]HPN44108.1 hypothetical protein [bacterium]
MGILVPITLFIVMGWIIKVLSDNHIRKLLIEKNIDSDSVKLLYSDKLEKYVPSAMKWGMVLVAIGLAIFLGKLMVLIPGFDSSRHDEEVFIFAMMFIMGGLALIIYYAMATKAMKKADDK